MGVGIALVSHAAAAAAAAADTMERQMAALPAEAARDAIAQVARARRTADDLSMLRASLEAGAAYLGPLSPSEESRLGELAQRLDVSAAQGEGMPALAGVIESADAIGQILRQSIGARPGNYHCSECGLPGSAPGAVCRACGGVIR